MNDDATAAITPGAARRADAGPVRLSSRDITGLVLCADMYGAPYNLLAAALGVRDDRLRAIVAHWRKAGYAASCRVGAGPGVVLADPAPGWPPPAYGMRRRGRRWRTSAPC